jgi:hypothetical protein
MDFRIDRNRILCRHADRNDNARQEAHERLHKVARFIIR